VSASSCARSGHLESPLIQTAQFDTVKIRSENQEARVVVAHGSWTFEGARHVSRGTLTAKHYFAKAADLDKRTDETKRLMSILYVGSP
jgi:hypothetical protein